jgi:hypothetical protein
MIFQSALLASLLWSASAHQNEAHTTTHSAHPVRSKSTKLSKSKQATQNAKISMKKLHSSGKAAESKQSHKNALKAKIREQLAVPVSMKAKLEKYRNYKIQASKLDLETTTFDEDTSAHLRRLKTKNNFLTFTAYDDAQCSMPTMNFGVLVNSCMNEQGDKTGNKRSYLIKVNKKENLAVEIEYEGFNCKVWPLLSIFTLALLTLLCSLVGNPNQGGKCALHGRLNSWCIR